MKVAILSDIHDNIWNLDKVLKKLKKTKVNTIVLCGDYCAPTTFKSATENMKAAYCVWGNVDGEKARIVEQVNRHRIGHVKLLGQLGEIVIDKRKIAINHYPDIALRISQSGKFDAVFYGHTHISKKQKVGKTLLLNPGSVCGIIDGKSSKASYAIYNTKTNSAKIIEIK